MLRLWAMWAVVGALSLAGCGDDDDAPATDAGPGSDAGDVDGGPPGDGGGDGGGGDGGGGDGGPGTCGDRAIDTGEQCDDGNTTDGDGCSSVCQREPSMNCGDSVVDYAMGEECDDGNTTGGDGCSDVCRVEAPPACGDGTLDIAGGEECDDGNTAAGDGCSPTCQYEPVGLFCGDGMVDPGEACDDGNTANGDACNPTCNFTNTSTLFVGMPGMTGSADGTGTAARLPGSGVLASDATYVWLAEMADGMSGRGARIRRIEIATADVVTVAGDGTYNLRDDPDGTRARFQFIESIATDGTTLWIGGSRRIRAMTVAPPHAVTTVVGNGTQGCNDGMGASVQFEDLRGLTYYGGHVYFLDSVCATLRRLDPSTGAVVTLAGVPRMTCPVGMTCPGVGTAARFNSPRYMASDNSGMLYVSDTNGAVILAFHTVTHELRDYAGNGVQGHVDGVGSSAQIHRPRGMTSDGTSIYWVEFNQHTIRQGVLATREVSTLFGRAGMAGYMEGVGAMGRTDGPFSITYHFPSRSLFFVDASATLRRIQ